VEEVRLNEYPERGKKVVITLPVLLVGGTEMQTLLLVRVLVEAGYEVLLCCFYDYDLGMVDSMEQAGATVVLLKQRWRDGLWVLLKRVTAFLRCERPDVVHVQYLAPGFITVLAARLARVHTVFATVHQSGRPYGWKAKFLLRTAARLCNVFFCVSQSVEKSWFGDSDFFDTSKGQKRRHVTIYNAVDVAVIAKLVEQADRGGLRQQLGLGDGPVVGCVGRLRHEKGQKILIDAMALLVQTIPEAKLVFVGDGPDNDMLIEQIDSLGLQGKVLLLGSMNRDDAVRHLSVMDVVAVPSLFEGFGLTAAEAMAAGLPVVGSAVDGLTEVVEDGVTGVLVSPGDSRALAAALCEMLQQPDNSLKMGQCGHKRVSKMFSIQSYRLSTLAAYSHFVKL